MVVIPYSCDNFSWVNGLSASCNANVFTGTSATGPCICIQLSPQIQNSRGGGSVAIKAEVNFEALCIFPEPKETTLRLVRGQSPAHKNTPTVMTFADSNQEDMLQSLVHSESPAHEEQQGGRLSHSMEFALLCKNQCFFTDLLINMNNGDGENIYHNTVF